MQYYLVNGQTQLIDRFSDKIKNQINASGFLNFEACDQDDQICACAVVRLSYYNSQVAYLEYMYVVEAYRGQGIAGDLLRWISRYLTDKGYPCMLCKKSGTAEELEDYYKYLLKVNFFPLYLAAHDITYDLDMLRNNPIIINSHEKKIPGVTTITEKNNPMLKRLFIAQKDDKKGNLFVVDFVPELSSFVVENGRITAAMLIAKNEDESYALVSSIYTAASGKNIFLPMFLDCIKKILKDTEKNVSFRLQIFEQKKYEVIKQHAGEPVQDFLLQQYMYIGD